MHDVFRQRHWFLRQWLVTFGFLVCLNERSDLAVLLHEQEKWCEWATRLIAKPFFTFHLEARLLPARGQAKHALRRDQYVIGFEDVMVQDAAAVDSLQTFRKRLLRRREANVSIGKTDPS